MIPEIVKEFTEALEGSGKNKTSPYDASGVVKRIDGNTAWVKLNGGVDETPVQMSISCQPGDTVQVRVGGGRAYITGNDTAPPTDDKTARVAVSAAAAASQVATKAQESAEQAQESIEETNETVSGMEQVLEEVQQAQESTNNHFWFDNTGVYVTEQEGSASTGYATRITNAGILQTYNGDTMSSWTNSGVTFFDYNGSAMASFERSGVNIYENGVSAATFGVSSRIGVSSANTVDVRMYGTYDNLSPGVWLYHNGTAIGGLTATQAPSATTNMKSIMMVGGDSNVQSEVYAGASKLGLSLERYASYTTSYKAEIVLYPGSANAELGTVKINTDNFKVTTAGKLTLTGEASVGSVSAGSATISGNASAGSATISGAISAGGSISSGANILASAEIGLSTDPASNGTAAVYWYKTKSKNYVLQRSSGSSKRFKEDIKPVESESLNPHRLYDLDVVQFKYKKGHFPVYDSYNENPYDLVGFIAEDVYEKYPIAAEVEDGAVRDWRERLIIPPMLKLIQEHKAKIDELEAEIKAMKGAS